MPPTSSPDDLTAARDLAEALRLTLRRLIREFRRETDDLGFSKLQFLLLAIICERPGVGVGELARLENLRGPTVSTQIKTLETAGAVTRAAPNVEDRRRVGLFPTDKGRAAIEALRRRRTDWLTQRIAALTPQSRRAIEQAIGPLGELAP
ncbi:MAG: MarR family transcriptional regulator [Hyphomicrobiales bacterium]|nr:MarR family transcriptional regulator [Hyphomicrobiales bacterium]MBV8662473.1 MarR family transcriptional regulator [Hyphomicrobiales bacterium]